MLDAERNYRKEPYTILCFGDSNTWGCVPKWQEDRNAFPALPTGHPLDKYPAGTPGRPFFGD